MENIKVMDDWLETDERLVEKQNITLTNLRRLENLLQKFIVMILGYRKQKIINKS